MLEQIVRLLFGPFHMRTYIINYHQGVMENLILM